MYFIKLMHLLLSIAVFYAFWLLFRYGRLWGMNRYNYRYNYYVVAVYGVLLYWFSKTYNAYLLGYFRIRALAFAQFTSQFFGVVLTYLIVSVAWKQLRAPWLFLPMLGVQLLLDLGWSFFATKVFFKDLPAKRTLLIYRNRLDKKQFGSIRGKPTERMYQITDELQYDGSFSELKDKLKPYDAVFVAGVNTRCRDEILKYCKENRIQGFFLPRVGDIIMREAEHIKSFDSPVLYVNRKTLDPAYAIIKRVFDLVSSGAALIILSPLMLITALAVRICDGGPAFYRQTRLTKDGKEFKILKFRSMRVDAERDGVARLSTGEQDDRITPVGRIIRKLRIDELPQLINIFLGDMSVVGPRPERPEIAADYCERMPDFKLRLQVKAGLTGYAQVYGKYSTGPYEKLGFDLLYIDHMSILTDLQICFATFAILFQPESTEGVKAGQTTAMDFDNREEYADNKEETVKTG